MGKKIMAIVLAAGLTLALCACDSRTELEKARDAAERATQERIKAQQEYYGLKNDLEELERLRNAANGGR